MITREALIDQCVRRSLLRRLRLARIEFKAVLSDVRMDFLHLKLRRLS